MSHYHSVSLEIHNLLYGYPTYLLGGCSQYKNTYVVNNHHVNAAAHFQFAKTRAVLYIASEDDVQVSAVILGLNSPTDLCVHWSSTR